MLVGRAREIVALELDPDLARELRDRLGDAPGLRIVEGDALEVDLEDLPFSAGPIRVLSNLPYSTATPILARLLPRERVVDLTVMVQKEVADRILAPPSSPDRGYLSVLASMHAEGRRLFEVGPGAFRPPPKVASCVIRLVRRDPGSIGIQDPEGLLDLVGRGFAHRRKTLYNNLRSAQGLDAEAWSAICAAIGLSPKVRAEALRLREWVALLDELGRSRDRR